MSWRSDSDVVIFRARATNLPAVAAAVGLLLVAPRLTPSGDDVL